MHTIDKAFLAGLGVGLLIAGFLATMFWGTYIINNFS